MFPKRLLAILFLVLAALLATGCESSTSSGRAAERADIVGRWRYIPVGAPSGNYQLMTFADDGAYTEDDYLPAYGVDHVTAVGTWTFSGSSVVIECPAFVYNGKSIPAQTVVLSSPEIDGSNLVVTTRTSNGKQSRVAWSHY